VNLTRRHLFGTAAAAGALAALPFDRAFAAAAADWALAVADVQGDLAPRPLRLVHGRAPKGLAGTLFRNGPARFTRGDTRAHWFDGDGLVRAFRIDGDGRAGLAARFVDTPKRRADAAAGAIATPGFGTRGLPTARVSGPDDLNAANTSMLAVGGKLWALWEGGSPIAVDPASLATLGPVRLSPETAGVPFLAHPRVEPDGRVWNLGLFGERAIVWRLSATGALESATPVELGRASYLHDFTATDRELVIVLQPWIREAFALPIIDGLRWRPEQGTQVLVLDKDDLSKRRVYDLPPLAFFHLGDAWREADGTIRFDGAFAPDVSHVSGDIDRMVAGEPFSATPPHMALVALRPDGRAEITRTATVGEFPQNDRRRAGSRRSLTWHVTGDERPLPRGLAVTDWSRERSQTYDFGTTQVVEEFLFTPRPGGTAEDDGWLVGTTVNLAARATELHVFDAARLTAGPVCSWRADVPLPAGFHGTFVPA